MTPSGHSRDGARQPARPSVPCAGRASVSSSVTIRGNRVHVPETGTLWARSGFVPAPPRNDPFSSFPTFRSRRRFSHPDGRQLRSGSSTANHIDPFSPRRGHPKRWPPRPRGPRPGSRSLPSTRAAVREHGPRGASRGCGPARAGLARASGGSSATVGGSRPVADQRNRARFRGHARAGNGRRLFPARGFAALSQPKAPSFRESVPDAADSALNNPKGARFEKAHRTAAPEIVHPEAGVP